MGSDIPPTLTPATTVEGALVDLAAAVQVAVELMIEDRSEQGLKATPWSIMLIYALKQFQDTGLVQRPVQEQADRIAQAYLLAYEFE